MRAWPAGRHEGIPQDSAVIRPEYWKLIRYAAGARWVRDQLETLLGKLPPEANEPDEDFDPATLEDHRRKTVQAIRVRQGQTEFRQALLRAYGGICAISQCPISQVLEAAHIHPYRGTKTNHVTNGILLRSDFHLLFDLGLIAVHPETHKVFFKPELLEAEDYAEFEDCYLGVPDALSQHPSPKALRWHCERWDFKI